MAVQVPSGEHELQRVDSIVEGQCHELVLTDQAVYFESRFVSSGYWLNSILFALGSVAGLVVGYMVLRRGQVLVRHSLDRVDSVTTKRVPIVGIVQAGVLAALVAGGLTWWHTRNVWYTYAVTTVLCLVASACMFRFQRTFLVVTSLNNTFSFKSFRSYEELLQIQDYIWQARNRMVAGVRVGD